MKKIAFLVTLEFTDKICDDNELQEVAENVARAIKNETNSGIGIAPENSEAITKSVEVSSDFLDVNVQLKLF